MLENNPDIWVNGTGQTAQGESHTSMAKHHLAEEAMRHDGRKTASPASGVGKARQPHVNQCCWNTPSHHLQKETQNGLKT